MPKHGYTNNAFQSILVLETFLVKGGSVCMCSRVCVHVSV